eukprot:g3183.t1
MVYTGLGDQSFFRDQGPQRSLECPLCITWQQAKRAGDTTGFAANCDYCGADWRTTEYPSPPNINSPDFVPLKFMEY